jgi:hypothetical protein
VQDPFGNVQRTRLRKQIKKGGAANCNKLKTSPAKFDAARIYAYFDLMKKEFERLLCRSYPPSRFRQTRSPNATGPDCFVIENWNALQAGQGGRRQ